MYAGGMQVEEFDYVIVGGGSAGCAVASRLSEDSKTTVCLLEAGGAGNNWVVKAPIGIAIMVPSKTNNWAFETVPQPGLNGRKGYQPRGKVLGGSSAINAMVYIRGHRSDYDGWAALGNIGWSYSDVLPYFKKSENNEVVQDAFHGTGGPLNVAGSRTSNPFQEHFLEAGRQLQLPLTGDFNGAEQMGLGVYQLTQKNGERWSAARAYIEPNLSRPNLKIVTGAQARKILFDDKRAIWSRIRPRRQAGVRAGAEGNHSLGRGVSVAATANAVRHRQCAGFEKRWNRNRASCARRRSEFAGPYRFCPHLPLEDSGQFRDIFSRLPAAVERNRTLSARWHRNDHVKRGGVRWISQD